MEARAATRVPVEPRSNRAERWFPFLLWARTYPKGALRKDAFAGVMAALVIIPEALGYSHLAGLHPSAGLYAIIFAGLVFTLLTTSRSLAVGPTGTVATLVALGIGAAHADHGRAAQVASTLAVMVGLLLVLGSLLRLGFLNRLISRPVALGYAAGTALTIILSQLSAIIGVEGHSLGFVGALKDLIAHFGELRPVPLVFGLSTLLFAVIVFAVKRPAAPIAVLLGSTAAVALLNLRAAGVALTDAAPAHGTPLAAPALDLALISALVPAALSIALLVFLHSVELARLFAQREGHRIFANHELVALGAMNVANGLAGTFPIGGSAADTTITESLHPKTPLAGVFVIVCAGLVLLAGGLLPAMPRAGLGALVIIGVVSTIHLRPVARIWRYDKREFALWACALVSVCAFGLIRGLVIAVVASILHLLWLASRPNTAQLGRRAGRETDFVDLTRHPDVAEIPGVLIFRVDSALFFANAERVADEIHALLRDPAHPTRAVILDLRAVNYLDLTGYDALTWLSRELAANGVVLLGANANAPLRAAFAKMQGQERALSPRFGDGSIEDALNLVNA